MIGAIAIIVILMGLALVYFFKKKPEINTADSCLYGCPGIEKCPDVWECGCDCHFEGIGR